MQTKCVDIHISMYRTSNKEWNAYFVILMSIQFKNKSKEKFEATKGAIRSRKSKNWRQTTIYKTLHRKPKIEKQEPTKAVLVDI